MGGGVNRFEVKDLDIGREKIWCYDLSPHLSPQARDGTATDSRRGVGSPDSRTSISTPTEKKFCAMTYLPPASTSKRSVIDTSAEEIFGLEIPPPPINSQWSSGCSPLHNFVASHVVTSRSTRPGASSGVNRIRFVNLARVVSFIAISF